MKHAHTRCIISFVAVALLCCASAQASALIPTTGGTLQWNTAGNWSGDIPNGAGALADIAVDLSATMTVNLQSGVTVGQLNIGDAAATTTNFASNIATTNGSTLTFQGAGGAAAQLNISGTGTAVNTLKTPTFLASDLNIHSAGTQILVTQDNAFNIGSNDVTITGGTLNSATWTMTSDLVGSGTITYSGAGGIGVSGVKSFTGTFVLNSGIGGSSNHGSLAMFTTGSVKDAAEIVVNGYVTNAANGAPGGGRLHVGSGSAVTVDPGQRLPSNTITLNGGWLNDGGNPANTAAPAAFVGGTITDTVANLNINSGYSYITMGNGSNTQTRLIATSLNREQGATVSARGTGFGGTNRLQAGNAADLVVGGGGAAGTTTMSIVPWMTSGNTGALGQSANFAVYDTTGGADAAGFRPLATTEVTGTWGATPAESANVNMRTSSFSIADTRSINSLQHNASSNAGINTSINLTIASGAISFSLNGGGLGTQDDDASNGTVNFGAAEGIIWTVAANVNNIKARLTGTGGLTKAGSGTLILQNNLNSITGKTVVGGGILQVGDATNVSNLGVGNVEVAGGALLKLVNDGAISDAAVVNLTKYGLFNGKLEIAAGLNETVGGLILGGVTMTGGTYSAVAGEGVDFVNADYFAGSGIVTVVPEPATMALLLMGGMAVVARRKRA